MLFKILVLMFIGCLSAAPVFNDRLKGLASCGRIFPTDLSGQQCHNLTHWSVGPMGDPITTAVDCKSACCESVSCTLYQFCSSCNDGAQGCFTGTKNMSAYSCPKARRRLLKLKF